VNRCMLLSEAMEPGPSGPGHGRSSLHGFARRPAFLLEARSRSGLRLSDMRRSKVRALRRSLLMLPTPSDATDPEAGFRHRRRSHYCFGGGAGTHLLQNFSTYLPGHGGAGAGPMEAFDDE
jgi:hypothetical protein